MAGVSSCTAEAAAVAAQSRSAANRTGFASSATTRTTAVTAWRNVRARGRRSGQEQCRRGATTGERFTTSERLHTWRLARAESKERDAKDSLSARGLTRLSRLGLVDQHHRNPIANRVASAAGITYEAVAVQ